MRYFTQGLVSGELNDGAHERAWADYNKRIDAIWHQLSSPLRSLAREVNLHDALFEQVTWNPASKKLHMSLIAGDVQRGYETVKLTYLGAILSDRSIESLHTAVCDRETQLLHDEVDLHDDDGGLTKTHRLLFWPHRELAIDFRELRLERTPRSNRTVELLGAFQIVHRDGCGSEGGDPASTPPA